MTATYKKIGHSDIETIVNLMKDFYAIDNYLIDLGISKKLFSEFIDNESLGQAWLIYSKDEVVGYVILTFVFNFEYKGKIAFVDELYLTKNARGKGIGKQTMEFVKSQAAELKLKLLYLEVETHNANARKLYLATDFEVHNRMIMKYKLN